MSYMPPVRQIDRIGFPSIKATATASWSKRERERERGPVDFFKMKDSTIISFICFFFAALRGFGE